MKLRKEYKLMQSKFYFLFWFPSGNYYQLGNTEMLNTS